MQGFVFTARIEGAVPVGALCSRVLLACRRRKVLMRAHVANAQTVSTGTRKKTPFSVEFTMAARSKKPHPILKND